MGRMCIKLSGWGSDCGFYEGGGFAPEKSAAAFHFSPAAALQREVSVCLAFPQNETVPGNLSRLPLGFLPLPSPSFHHDRMALFSFFSIRDVSFLLLTSR